eukprot:TRINITY_DN12853_c0_g2_i1.p1 TRINITY_DN12853_c0_g2~~TRINITY_DN12853_c0_g2_i1.p1  ORF type:complete len:323 (+),score=28.89 TRINITY_DN12853_c0_g2_i1:96-1064(+)
MDESLAPVVFLHGLADSWRSFEHLWPRLTMKRRIIAIDFRGHGNSSKSHTASYSLEVFMQDVNIVMKALRITNIGCLVGHSLGSVVAWRFAGTWPTRVERLVLIGTVPYIKPGLGSPLFSFKVLSSILGNVDSAPRWFAESAIADSVANISDMGDWFHDTCAYQTMLWAPFMLEKLLHFFGDELDPSITKPIISSIVARTTVITGEADSTCPSTKAKPMMQLLHPQCNASMHVVPGQGHSVQWTKRGADFVAARIADLLSDRPVSDSALVEQPVASPGMMPSAALPVLTLLLAVGGLSLASRMVRPIGATGRSSSEPLLRGS